MSGYSYRTDEEAKEKLKKGFEDVEAEYQRLLNKCEELESDTFQEGNAELEIYEQKHTWSIRLSYFFFGLGWALGLATNIVGGGSSETV